MPRVGAGDEAEAEATATTDAGVRAVADGLGCGYAGAGLEATRTWNFEDVAAPKHTRGGCTRETWRAEGQGRDEAIRDAARGASTRR